MDFDLCPFSVPENVRQLAEEVEASFRREIPLSIVEVLPSGGDALGCYAMREDVIAIFLKPDAEDHVLAHELLHVKRLCKGIPYAWHRDPAVLDMLASKIEMPLEHYSFFPVLHDMFPQFNPHIVGTQEFLKRVLPEFVAGPGDMPIEAWRIALAAAVWDIELNNGDDSYRAAVRVMVGGADRGAMENGVAVAEHIKKNGLETPRKKVDAVRAIVRICEFPQPISLFKMLPLTPSEGNWYKRLPYSTIKPRQW